MTRKLIVALTVFFAGLMMPQLALAQGANPAWMAGKWALGGDCAGRGTFTLQADGTLIFQDGARGRWRTEGSQLVFVDGGETEGFGFTKVNNDTFNVGDAVVARCGPPPAPLDAKWLTGTKWSGHSNCAVVITFASGGRVTVSNGARGTWSISGGRILMAVGDGKPLMLERRNERQLIEVESQSAFVRCS